MVANLNKMCYMLNSCFGLKRFSAAV